MKVNNYFTMMIDRYGDEDFISKLKPEQIQKSAKDRIFKEMVLGKIDYTVYGKFFLDSKFLENLIIAAENELTNKTVTMNALQFYDLNYPGNANTVHNLTVNRMLVQVYNCLLNKLQALKYNGDIGTLVDIQYILRNCRMFM